MAAQIFPFISRAQQLQICGSRNYSQWMMVTKGHVAPDGPEREQWKAEALAESKADAEWAKHHGRVDGGAWVARFPQSPESPTQKRRRTAQRR